MAIVTLCDDMKWTYQEYLEQPEWFIELLMIKKRADSDYQKLMNKKSGNNKNTTNRS